MIKKAQSGPCEAVVKLVRYTDLMILRAVKCQVAGTLTFDRHLPESGLVLCLGHVDEKTAA